MTLPKPLPQSTEKFAAALRAAMAADASAVRWQDHKRANGAVPRPADGRLLDVTPCRQQRKRKSRAEMKN
jgi:hypothetical protein